MIRQALHHACLARAARSFPARRNGIRARPPDHLEDGPVRRDSQRHPGIDKFDFERMARPGPGTGRRPAAGYRPGTRQVQPRWVNSLRVQTMSSPIRCRADNPTARQARPRAAAPCSPRPPRHRQTGGQGYGPRSGRLPPPGSPSPRPQRPPSPGCPGPPGRYAARYWSPVRWPAAPPHRCAGEIHRAPRRRMRGPPAPAPAPPGSSRSAGPSHRASGLSLPWPTPARRTSGRQRAQDTCTLYSAVDVKPRRDIGGCPDIAASRHDVPPPRIDSRCHCTPGPASPERAGNQLVIRTARYAYAGIARIAKPYPGGGHGLLPASDRRPGHWLRA